jgi:CRP-like cAMP-binding protein
MSETLWHLKHCDLFHQLTPEEFTRLESRSRFRTYPARSPIYLPEEKADSIFLVAEGLVKVSNLSPDGKEAILAFIEPGEIFGELALLDIRKRDEFVEAVNRTTVVMIPADEFQRIISIRADVSLAITKLVGMRRQRIERRLKNLLFQSTRDRLIHLLLDLEEQFGQDTPEGVRLRIKLSHQDLGNLIGATRETVTSLLGQLRVEGSIEYKRCKIVLKNVPKLAIGVQRIVSPRYIQKDSALSVLEVTIAKR